MDALIKALEKRGYPVSIFLDGKMTTEVVIGDTRVGVALKEGFKRIERTTAASEKNRRFASDRYYYDPDGIFSFSLTAAVNVPGNWHDRNTGLLEERLNDIVVGIFRAAEALRQKEIEQKKEERKQTETAIKREKEKLLLKKENACRERLEQLSVRRQQSRELRRFLKEYETKIIEQNKEVRADGDCARLLEWAYGHADRLDPLTNGEAEELFEQFKHQEDEPEDEDSYEYSHLLWKLKFL